MSQFRKINGLLRGLDYSEMQGKFVLIIQTENYGTGVFTAGTLLMSAAFGFSRIMAADDLRSFLPATVTLTIRRTHILNAKVLAVTM